MSQRIRKGLRQLCQGLFCIAALKLCTAAGRLRPEAKAASNGAAASGIDIRSEEKALSSALTLVGKVLGSLPTNKENHVNSLSAIEVFVSKLREEVLEFAALDKAEKKPFVPCFGKRTRAKRSAGLENLKVTLNLARGDLEASLAF